MSNTTDFIIRALEHCAKRIKAFEDDPEIKSGNDIIKSDIRSNYEDIEYLVQHYKSGGTSSNLKLLCSAIDCYIRDLDEARKITEKRLSEIGINIDYKNVEKEIEESKIVKTRIGCR